MGKVVLDATMSLDGFIAGPNVGVEQPMGEGGLRLHDWIFNTATSPVDADRVRDAFASTGAVVLGRRTFDVGIGEWEGTPFPAPCFVLTHDVRGPRVEKSGTFTFINDVDSAYREATAAAGGKDVRLMGADISNQFLKAGLVDEVRIQLAPVLLGDGLRMFDCVGSGHIELERIQVIESPYVTHLRFRVINKAMVADP